MCSRTGLESPRREFAVIVVSGVLMCRREGLPMITRGPLPTRRCVELWNAAGFLLAVLGFRRHKRYISVSIPLHTHTHTRAHLVGLSRMSVCQLQCAARPTMHTRCTQEKGKIMCRALGVATIVRGCVDRRQVYCQFMVRLFAISFLPLPGVVCVWIERLFFSSSCSAREAIRRM